VTTYTFQAFVAYDRVTGDPLPGAVLEAYALADPTFTTPLTVADLAGVESINLVSNPSSIVGDYQIEDEPVVRLVSGDNVFLAVSYQGLAADSAAALLALETYIEEHPNLDLPAGRYPGATLGVDADGELVWQDPVTGGGSGIVGAPSSWPSSFPPDAHTTSVADLRRNGTTGTEVTLAAAIASLLAANDAAAGRTAIGAAPDTTVSFPGFGPAATQAMVGNKTFTAAEISAAAVTGYTGSTVQGLLAQIGAQALLGGSGGGSVPTGIVVIRRYTSGAWPVRGTLPSGAVVWWVGPASVGQPTTGGSYMVAGTDFYFASDS
jgi:hypothetical protein